MHRKRTSFCRGMGLGKRNNIPRTAPSTESDEISNNGWCKFIRQGAESSSRELAFSRACEIAIRKRCQKSTFLSLKAQKLKESARQIAAAIQMKKQVNFLRYLRVLNQLFQFNSFTNTTWRNALLFLVANKFVSFITHMCLSCPARTGDTSLWGRIWVFYFIPVRSSYDRPMTNPWFCYCSCHRKSFKA